ncbi:MAG: hypothetical protein L3K26_20470, partial [Candidatus Hydrogenedentes bacterium]|nr:hypothetical protein [Candidatus Hydrogenedentota bacterium]
MQRILGNVLGASPRFVWLPLLLATLGVQAQPDSIEALRAEHQEQLEAIQQSFETRLTALEEKMAEAAPKSTDLRAYWKSGIRLENSDGDFKLRINGRIQNDWAFYDETRDFGDISDGTEFRRARIALRGSIYHDFHFKAQYDFADGDVDFKDVYIGATHPKFGTFRVGHMKEPFGFNELASSNNISFMERALPNAFAPSRNTGLLWTNTFLNDRIVLAGGVFKDVGGFGDDNQREENWAYTARIAGRPWLNEAGDRYLHLGAAVSYRDSHGTVRYRSRPEAHAGGVGRYVDTRTDRNGDGTPEDILADDILLLGL